MLDEIALREEIDEKFSRKKLETCFHAFRMLAVTTTFTMNYRPAIFKQATI